ncbi:GNAT family N-acetyltransferase [soil metagenome]
MLVTLRDVAESDLLVFFEQQREPEASRMAAFPARERDAFFAHWRTKVLGSAETTKQTIVVDGAVAGHIGSWGQGSERLVGYWIGKAYWGQGVATAALAEFVATHETARPLRAFVAATNAGSVRVLEKCGFRRVGDPARGEDGVEELVMQLGA